MTFVQPEKRLSAYLPLADAVTAWSKFGYCLPQQAAEWRVNYFAAITLLRSVGHVLHKVDSKDWPAASGAIRSAFIRWNEGSGEDAIFPHFIESERNFLVKEYRRGCEPEDAIDCPVLAVDGQKRDDITIIPIVFFEGGPFDGEAVESLIARAIEWWILELEAIEDVARGTGGTR